MNLSATLPFLNPIYVHEPVQFVTGRLLRGSQVRYDAALLAEKLAAHPYFPSLLSISDTLHEMGIPHQAYRTDITTLVGSFNRPALVFLKMNEGLLGVVERVDNAQVTVITEGRKVQHLSLDHFSEIWDGVVLELKQPPTDHRYKNTTKPGTYPGYVRYAGLALSLLLLVALLWNNTTSSLQGGLFILNLFGLGTSWLLVLQSLNKNNELVLQLCQSDTQKGCGTVLSSEASRLTPWFSMAEAGLVYFSGTTCLLALFPNPVLYTYLSIAAPIVSLYAVFLQAVVLREWCKLCMAAHAVVLLCFSISLAAFIGNGYPTAALPDIMELLVFVLPTLLWVFVSPYIKELRDGQFYKLEFRKLKSNPELFAALLQRQPRTHIPDALKLFTFGDPHAAHELVLVSNPYCRPCARAHEVLHTWLEEGVSCKVTLIFSHPVDRSDKRRQFVELVSGVEDRPSQWRLFNEWFSNEKKDLEEWAKRHGLSATTLPYKDELLREWLAGADVKATPTIFVNGYRLPAPYRLEDIKYLIAEVR